MKASYLLAVAVLTTTACTGTPTGGNEPKPMPTGTILAATPNGAERGTYLINVQTGKVSQIPVAQDLLSLAWQGGYSHSRELIYGTKVSPPFNLLSASLDGSRIETLLTLPHGMTPGAYDLSPDGRTLAIQTATTEVQLWTVDLVSDTWTQHVDQGTGIDTLPLARIRWSPNGQHLFAIIDVFPTRSELVRIDPIANVFEIISPTTPINVVASVDVAPDGSVIAHGDGAARITFRTPDGAPITGLPDLPGMISRPVFSPDGEFLAYQEFGPAPDFRIKLMIVRLSDGKRWPVNHDAEFELWLSDWTPEGAM